MKAYTAIAISAIFLAGCETNPIDDFNKAWNSEAKGTVVPVTAQVMQVRIPKDKGVRPHHSQLGTFVVVRDIGYTDRHTYHKPAAYTRLLYENPQPRSFKIHARYDNGAAGSGIRYEIQYSVDDKPNEYVINLKPITEEVYQQGMGSKLPVPDFKINDVYQHLANVDIAYSFEIDAPYNTDSITANFMRNRGIQRIGKGYTDPVTGKIISTAYQMPLGNVLATFTLDVYPYRNGSKAVINALIPGMQTSPGVVDFKILIDKVKSNLTSIANS